MSCRMNQGAREGTRGERERERDEGRSRGERGGEFVEVCNMKCNIAWSGEQPCMERERGGVS